MNNLFNYMKHSKTSISNNSLFEKDVNSDLFYKDIIQTNYVTSNKYTNITIDSNLYLKVNKETKDILMNLQ